MVEWESDDETITKWSFYGDDHKWHGMITEGEDDFSWWVMVPPTGSALSLVAEGDAHDREQAERLAEAAAKMLLAELNPPKVDLRCDSPEQVRLAADHERASRDLLTKGGK